VRMYHADDANEFGVTRFAEVDWHPHYNVAPNQIVETIISVNGEKCLGPMRWGFVPPTAKEPKLAPINARAERPYPPHRCFGMPSDVIAASSWRTGSTNGGRTTDVGGRAVLHQAQVWRPFGFAGIWSMKHGERGTRLATCTRSYLRRTAHCLKIARRFQLLATPFQQP
jgi:putative SOS response-associated peptidase YedK